MEDFLMEKFITKDGRVIFYESGGAIIHDPEGLAAEKAEIEKRIPQLPTDEELLEWAKANYNFVNYEAEKARLAEIDAILVELNI
jgi:hypothetical protein